VCVDFGVLIDRLRDGDEMLYGALGELATRVCAFANTDFDRQV
jgi:hypothetical protein